MARRVHTVVFFCILISCIQRIRCTFSFTEETVSIRVQQNRTIGFVITNPLDLIEYSNVTVNFVVENGNIVEVDPQSVDITDEIFELGYIPLTIRGIAPGKSDILTKINPGQLRI
ncbi:hypothetical protein Trydic_g901 [Trypoxylus dichotomus]